MVSSKLKYSKQKHRTQKLFFNCMAFLLVHIRMEEHLERGFFYELYVKLLIPSQPQIFPHTQISH
jgi:hypothetical protein